MSAQLDMFGGPSPEQARHALELRAAGRIKAKRAQKAPGSDGGLFDSGARAVELLPDRPAFAKQVAAESAQ